jgi:hypothetical protein
MRQPPLGSCRRAIRERVSQMITKTDMMSVLLDACPSFSTKWESSRDEWRQEADGPPLSVGQRVLPA